jgi:hypothetical protein
LHGVASGLGDVVAIGKSVVIQRSVQHKHTANIIRNGIVLYCDILRAATEEECPAVAALSASNICHVIIKERDAAGLICGCVKPTTRYAGKASDTTDNIIPEGDIVNSRGAV